MKTCPNCHQIFAAHYNFCLQDGSFLTFSDKPEIETVVSERKIKAELFASLDVHPAAVIAINIAQQFPLVKNASELYEVTRGLWRVSQKHAEKAKYAFAVFQREIKEVYEISYWELASPDSIDFWIERYRKQGVEINPAKLKGRFQFIGKTADDFVREQYVGKQLPNPHGQNPIQYFDD